MQKTSRISLRIATLILAATFIVACSKETRRARFLAEGDLYFKAGNYDKAKLTYLNVLQLEPQNALALGRIGAMWLEEGVPLRAGLFLTKASQLDPNNSQNRIRLVRCYLALGQSGDAKKEALRIIEQFPDNGEAMVALTEAVQSPEEIEAAERRLQSFPGKNDISFHLASANLLLRKGDLAGTADALQQAMIVDPKSSASHTAMGVLRLFQKDPKQAAAEFKNAADLAPVRSAERLKYAEFMAGTGEPEEAKRILTEMTRQASDSIQAWCLLADLALKEKKPDEALSLLENVFGRDADNIDGRRLEGEVWLAKGDAKKATDVLGRLDKIYPGVPVIKYQLARAYLQNNNINQASVALNQAIEASPNYDDAILLLAEINLRSGHSELVIGALTDLLKKLPNLTRAGLLLADAYRTLGRFDDAVAVIREQARLSPQDPQPETSLGVIFRQAKRNDEARRAFEKAAELAPDDLLPVDQLVDLDLLDKHFDSARRRIQRHFQKAPDSPAAHFLEGKILAAEGKWDAAEAALEKTLDLDPSFSSAYDLLVQACLATDKLPQAISRLQGVLSKDPNNTSTGMALALVYEQMKDFSKARDAYEKLLSTNPTLVPALNNLAYIYAEQLNDLDQAYDLARKARDLQAHDPSIGDTLGWVLCKRGEFQQALTILQESAEKVPDRPEVQFHLGMTAYMMGQTAVARAALQKAASAKTDFPGKDECERRLALLESGANASPELSIGQLEAMVKEQPNDVVTQMRLGEAYEKAGASGKAAAAFEQALKLNPKLAAAVTKLAQLNAGPLKNTEKALDYAKQARDLAPTDPHVAGILGMVAYQSGNFAWSYSLLEDAVRRGGNDAETLHNLAWAAYSFGKMNEALEAMQKALKTNPASPQAADAKKFLALTALAENPEELKAAEVELQAELKSNPEYVPALMAQAALHAQHGQTKLAREIYLDILGRFPDSALAQKRLAALYAQDASTVAAASDLVTKARKTTPDDPELSGLLGQLSYQKKEYPRAIQLLQESARTKPLDAMGLYYLGMSYLRAEQEPQAREALERSLAAGLQGPFAEDARRTIAGTEKH